MSLKKLLVVLIGLNSLTKALDSNVPFHINLYESHIPGQLADKLISDIGSANGTYYERLFVERKYQNGLDEYICELAPVLILELDQEVMEEESEAEILAAATNLIHLSFSKDSCVWAYDFRGWYWTYAFCFGDKVIQYHEGAHPSERPHKHVPIAPSSVFVLGRFTKASIDKVEFGNQVSESQYKTYLDHATRSYRLLDEKSSPFSHHSSQRVVLQMATDGTLCDMTRQPRTLELMYLCSESGGYTPQIMDVVEIKTCHYKMIVHVPALCQYKPFIPNRHVQDSLVDIACQKVDRESSIDIKPDATFDDFLGVTVLRDDDEFPVRADNRINIAEHRLDDLGGGFQMAACNYEYVSSSEYFNSRTVAVFTGKFETLEDLNLQFGRTIYDSIEKKLIAPTNFEGLSEELSWLHKFVLWSEIYDATGEFLGLARLESTGDDTKRELDALLIDPVTLTEGNGDQPYFVRFERPEFQAPFNFWNFEVFYKNGAEPYTRRKRITKEKITLVEKLPDKEVSEEQHEEEDLLQVGLVDQRLEEHIDFVEDDGQKVIKIADEDEKENLNEDEIKEPQMPSLENEGDGDSDILNIFEDVEDTEKRGSEMKEEEGENIHDTQQRVNKFVDQNGNPHFVAVDRYEEVQIFE